MNVLTAHDGEQMLDWGAGRPRGQPDSSVDRQPEHQGALCEDKVTYLDLIVEIIHRHGCQSHARKCPLVIFQTDP